MSAVRTGKQKVIGTPAARELGAFEQKMLRYRHNALLGSIGMSKSAMRSVQGSCSTTMRAKRFAAAIAFLLEELDNEVREWRVGV